ncbi:LacI family DNA-binding transcriptional regulator [Sporosarcina sp. FSL K6-6792]|uniref:LacI family DNA-binding transcriptional regulator n=1 Tax=Sporosarcina sp. FSL K6-6792 TaxID=2921559 RepID=UPI0030FCC060
MKQKQVGRVTIYDVAREAGVSKTSVSRYLGERYNELSEKTRKKIEETIIRMNYRPNTMARGLKFGQSHLIGMVVADITNPHTTAMIRGAEDLCNQNGYSLMVCNTDNNAVKEQDYIKILQSHRIEGLIINTTGGSNDALFQVKEEDDIPVVLIDRKVPELELDTIGLDNHQATESAVTYLVKQGYERIAFFSQPIHQVSTRYERFMSFQKTLRNVQHTSIEDVYEIQIEPEDSVQLQLQEFLESSNGQTRAILTANSVVLLKIILELNKQGFSIPNDVALMGFDNPKWVAVVGSGISTIEQPTYQIGVTAMETLLKRINGDNSNPQTISFEATLVIRGSTPLVKK